MDDFSEYDLVSIMGVHDAYRLSKWSKLVRERDNNTCYMCGRPVVDGSFQSHHIRPKSRPEFCHLVYDLSNGITLCVVCHLFSVHGDNNLDGDNCDKFIPMFDAYMDREYIRSFNEQNQSSI